MNTIIIQQFNNLIDELNLNKPSNYTFKIKSFKNVINTISQLDYEITLDIIKNKKLFSDKINSRICEILNNGNLSEINNSLSHNNYKTNFKNLISITGIGPSKAKQLLDYNITLETLLNNNSNYDKNLLTHHQHLGIKYYYDLQKKIPNSIIKQVEHFLEQFNFNFTICGSYRRKKDLSGDIDILINDDNKLAKFKTKNKLKYIINLLSSQPYSFLTDHLTINGHTKYMGICKLQSFSQFMRIDIRIVKPEQYPFAILYFTGSKNTNTFMRNKAISLGFKLNEYGLFDRYNDNIFLNSEADIFEALNLTYINPEDR